MGRRSHRYTEEQIDRWEEQSFKNLCEFYREELIAIMKGKKVSEIFTVNKRTRLGKLGVLTTLRSHEPKVSQRAKKVLKVPV